jgi:ribosomal protein L11 methyltransferase
MAMLARRRRVKCVLDLGTGSGLLAIAAARLGARRVVAIDNDAEAVRVAARHVALNRRRGQVTVGLSDGYAGAIARRHSPYDLVLANVLAGPLIAMARDTARAIAPRGHAILSGLLDEQAGEVLGVHRRLGLRLVDRRSLQGWTTLVLAARTI